MPLTSIYVNLKPGLLGLVSLVLLCLMHLMGHLRTNLT